MGVGVVSPGGSGVGLAAEACAASGGGMAWGGVYRCGGGGRVDSAVGAAWAGSHVLRAGQWGDGGADAGVGISHRHVCHGGGTDRNSKPSGASDFSLLVYPGAVS